MATLVLLSTMCVQLVVAVEALATEAALRVALETTLINSARVVVAELLVLSKLGKGEELVFVGENLLIPRTQVARLSQLLTRKCVGTSRYCRYLPHNFAVCRLRMTVQVGPAQTRNIAFAVRTVVLQ